MTLVPFSDVARAAYCPRQLYYRRRDEEQSVPPKTRGWIGLAYRYDELTDAPNRALRAARSDRRPATAGRRRAR